MHSDKYGAYETMAKTKQFVWTPCWAHIRRKFKEAESGDPVFRQWVLRQIRYLFMLERDVGNQNPIMLPPSKSDALVQRVNGGTVKIVFFEIKLSGSYIHTTGDRH